MDEEIKKLRGQTERTRRQFLNAEIQTCVTALEMGEYELSVGNLPVVEREIAAAAKGLETMQRYLLVVSPREKEELEARLAALSAAIRWLKAGFSAASR